MLSDEANLAIESGVRFPPFIAAREIAHIVSGSNGILTATISCELRPAKLVCRETEARLPNMRTGDTCLSCLPGKLVHGIFFREQDRCHLILVVGRLPALLACVLSRLVQHTNDFGLDFWKSEYSELFLRSLSERKQREDKQIQIFFIFETCYVRASKR